MGIGDLERNDVAGAVAYVAKVLDDERDLDPDDAQSLTMLQDDPAELSDALAELYESRERRGLAVPSFWK